MAEAEPELGLLSIDNLVELLPRRCRSCPWAQFLIIMTVTSEIANCSPGQVIDNIHEQCVGYVGIRSEKEELFQEITAEDEPLEDCSYYALQEEQ